MLHQIAAALLYASAAATPPTPVIDQCPLEIVVLGAGQDAGAPQIGNNDDPAWDDPDKRLLATSIALIDRDAGERFLFEATPDIVEQLRLLDEIAPDDDSDRLGIDGIFLTHAHMGHYTGLAFLGFESANAKRVPVYALPRMARFLRENGPWSQLVAFGNIEINEFDEPGYSDAPGRFSNERAIWVIPWHVPHRDEFSETAAFSIAAGNSLTLFLPDLDTIEQWEADVGRSFEALIGEHDLVFIDSTFFDDNELDRDMSAIPHPRTKATMDRLAHLPEDERAKVHFIHYNHSNPIRDPASPQSRMVEDAGFNIARRGDRHCLPQ